MGLLPVCRDSLTPSTRTRGEPVSTVHNPQIPPLPPRTHGGVGPPRPVDKRGTSVTVSRRDPWTPVLDEKVSARHDRDVAPRRPVPGTDGIRVVAHLPVGCPRGSSEVVVPSYMHSRPGPTRTPRPKYTRSGHGCPYESRVPAGPNFFVDHRLLTEYRWVQVHQVIK